MLRLQCLHHSGMVEEPRPREGDILGKPRLLCMEWLTSVTVIGGNLGNLKNLDGLEGRKGRDIWDLSNMN